MLRLFAALGATFAFLGVALGAFGAHLLKERLAPDMLTVYQTGVQYQTMHALALILIALLAANIGESRLLRASGWLIVAGIIVFSGSLYALALTGNRVLGAITPIGGLCFLSGWVCAILALLGSKGSRT